MRAVAAVFLEQLPTLIASVGEAVEANDPVALQAIAHRLKGAAGALGSAPMTELARRLELAGAHQDLDAVAPVWQQIRALVPRLEAQLRERLRIKETDPGPGSRE
jgi:HPt (histidine-containing phosphotransfer) domain-containing protein